MRQLQAVKRLSPSSRLQGPQLFFCLPRRHRFIVVRLLWWNRLTTCTVIPSLSSTATIINNIIITFFFNFQPAASGKVNDPPNSLSWWRRPQSVSRVQRPEPGCTSSSCLLTLQLRPCRFKDTNPSSRCGYMCLGMTVCFFLLCSSTLFFWRRGWPEGDGPAAYRSSLSTRPPGCSTGLESGKKAAFTSRPRSVRAA